MHVYADYKFYSEVGDNDEATVSPCYIDSSSLSLSDSGNNGIAYY